MKAVKLSYLVLNCTGESFHCFGNLSPDVLATFWRCSERKELLLEGEKVNEKISSEGLLKSFQSQRKKAFKNDFHWFRWAPNTGVLSVHKYTWVCEWCAWAEGRVAVRRVSWPELPASSSALVKRSDAASVQGAERGGVSPNRLYGCVQLRHPFKLSLSTLTNTSPLWPSPRPPCMCCATRVLSFKAHNEATGYCFYAFPGLRLPFVYLH